MKGMVTTWVVNLGRLIVQPAVGLLGILILNLAGCILIPVVRLGGISVEHPARRLTWSAVPVESEDHRVLQYVREVTLGYMQTAKFKIPQCFLNILIARPRAGGCQTLLVVQVE